MKALLFLAACLVAGSPAPGAERPLEPLGGEGELVRAWAIEGFHEANSVDERVRVTIVVETVGHTFNARRLLATFTADGPVEGESLETTTFDLGRFGSFEPPKLVEKVNDRLYRLSFGASVSDTMESALLKFTYDVHLADGGRLARVVPVLDYSSYWDMDGSRMGLVASGSRRSIYYVDPKPGSGATPGTLFFNGIMEGDGYRGKVLNWRFEEGGQLPLQGESARNAEGEVRDDGATVVLTSQAVEWKDGGNVPVGPRTTHLLRFKGLAGAPE